MSKPVYIIVACAQNRAIGKNGQLPWRIPEDAQYYDDMTRGGIVIYGRRCYEELGHAMPERKTIVLTRNADLEYPDAFTASSMEEALQLAEDLESPGPIWIAGGEGVYQEALHFAEKLYLTLIQSTFEADTFFPEWDPPFSETLSKRPSSDENYHYDFYEFGRPRQG